MTAKLLDDAKRGDPQARDDLYRCTCQAVYRHIQDQVQSKEAAEDIVRNTYLKVWSNLDQIRDAAAFPGWVLSIADGAAADWRRSNSPQTGNTGFSQMDCQGGRPVSGANHTVPEEERYRAAAAPGQTYTGQTTGNFASEPADTAAAQKTGKTSRMGLAVKIIVIPAAVVLVVGCALAAVHFLGNRGASDEEPAEAEQAVEGTEAEPETESSEDSALPLPDVAEEPELPEEDTGDEVLGSEAAEDTASEAEQTDAGLPVTLERTVFADTDHISCVIDRYTYDEEGGHLWVELTNTSDSASFIFGIMVPAVNGINTNCDFILELGPGETFTGSMDFTSDLLRYNGVTLFTDISFFFEVFSSSDPDSPLEFAQMLHIYPYGEEYAEPYVRESQPTDKVILDTDAYTLIMTGYDPDVPDGCAVNLYAVSKSEDPLNVILSDGVVNGTDMSVYAYMHITGGNSCFGRIFLSDSDWADAGITEIQSLTATVKSCCFSFAASLFQSGDIYNGAVTLMP